MFDLTPGAFINKPEGVRKMSGKKTGNDPYSVLNAIKNGDIFTRLTMLVNGLGNLVRGQIIKGLIFLAVEAVFIYYMITAGFNCIINLIHLGGKEQEKVWNEALQVYQYTAGDNTLLFLLYGVATIFVIVFFVISWRAAVKSSYMAQKAKQNGKKPLSIKDDIKGLFDKNLHKTLLTLPTLGVVAFTILPLVFMISMAFTSYTDGETAATTHLTIFNWVGLENFKTVLNFKGTIGKYFWSVLGWTLIWAVLATFSNYILGMILAIVINRKKTRCKGMWRSLFMISAAVPQFVSLLLMRTMFNRNGIVNTLLQRYMGVDSPLPFWENATWARVLVVVINIWIGIPFTMLQITGILQNIPGELYEAAKVDGAGPVKTFFHITLPYMLFVTTPYLITSFTGNINNFNVIFLLSGGGPNNNYNKIAPGKTDLLVTWLYNLTVEDQRYNIGAVIGIMTFLVLAIVSLVTYHRTGSYKNEEGFQ